MGGGGGVYSNVKFFFETCATPSIGGGGGDRVIHSHNSLKLRKSISTCYSTYIQVYQSLKILIHV